MNASNKLLSIQGLDVSFRFSGDPLHVVKGVDLDIEPGRIHAVVGESGSGKTMLARSILGLLPPGALVDRGEILFEGNNLLDLSPKEIRSVRGAGIGMIFQEPLVSLNPAMRVGTQMFEAMRLHTSLPDGEIRKQAIEMLDAVKMPDPVGALSRYPHEFSGGMRQRIMIASVMMLRPALLLADEPTTALDALVQREVLDIMANVVTSFGTAIMLVTHDLSVVARYADEISVMEKGLIVESGETRAVLRQPKHPYTRRLLSSLPRPPAKANVTETQVAPLLSAKGLHVQYELPAKFPFSKKRFVHALRGVSLDILPGEMLGIVGESGSGKSTLGRALIQLLKPSEGRVLFDGADLTMADRETLRSCRPDMQIVFQDPYSSLNPRMKLGEIVGEGLKRHKDMSAERKIERVRQIFEATGLESGFVERYPHEISGGQRQRIAIARALVTNPKLVVADEPVSALDVTVQKQILELLTDLKSEFSFACLFISHDLAVVESICDRVMVMHQGRIVESAGAGVLFSEPRHPYTRRLMAAAPILTPVGDGYELDAARSNTIEDDRWDTFDEHLPLREVGPRHFAAV